MERERAHTTSQPHFSSPPFFQAFYNLNQRSDIFNHSNIHFWEYAQHGYDAIGFISCTGTNFLIRSAAFRDAGWSPEYTLTEDYALGMELKKRSWHCRYVEEYLVIGEAPEQVRNCFQQRSRWAKGHFQIVFSKNNPLLQKELSWGMRVLYCSGVWSYFVGAVTTPLFMLIPILTIWAGTFPIVVSKWAAIGLTIYSVAQTFVLNFMRKRSHYEPIWFATIANNILWWTFVKACFNSLLSLIPGRKKITFKTTMKGSGALAMAASAIGDLWMPTVSFFALAASLGVGISKLAAGPSVVTTLSISVVWILYGMIPSFLLLWYTFIGRGATLAFMCRVCFFLSYACSLLALMLLWAVYPAEFDYGAAAGDSLKFYGASRLGDAPADAAIPFRGPTFGYEASPKYAFADLTGGWANGGAIGTVKLSMTTAFTTTLMAWGLLTFPKGYAKAGEAGAALDTIRWGADYLLKTVREDTGPRKGYVLAYQVGNLTLDAADWSTPENMTEAQVKRPAYVVKTSQGASDLGGSVAAALASSSLAVRSAGGDAAYADTLLTTARGLYAAAAAREGLYGARTPYVCSSKWAKGKAAAAKPVASCPPPTAFANGSALAFYNSTTYRDDLLWAAAWLYKATNESIYMDDVTKWYSAHVEFEGARDAPLVFDWNNVFLGANVLLAQITDEGAFHVTIQDMLKQWICATTNKVLFTPKGRAWNREAPSTGATANAALLSLMYGQLASKEVTRGKRDRYTCFARAQMRYILGDGGRSLMVGRGKKPPRHIQSRMAACPKAPAACDAAVHLYGPSPDPNLMRGAIVEFPAFDDHYADVRATNDSRVSIENNAGAGAALAGLNQATGTWDQCLQGFGVLTKDYAVCEADLYVRE
jgi:endoglucanase